MRLSERIAWCFLVSVMAWVLVQASRLGLEAYQARATEGMVTFGSLALAGVLMLVYAACMVATTKSRPLGS